MKREKTKKKLAYPAPHPKLSHLSGEKHTDMHSAASTPRGENTWDLLAQRHTGWGRRRCTAVSRCGSGASTRTRPRRAASAGRLTHP